MAATEAASRVERVGRYWTQRVQQAPCRTAMCFGIEPAVGPLAVDPVAAGITTQLGVPAVSRPTMDTCAHRSFARWMPRLFGTYA